MEWRVIPGYPDYEVSENGDVRRATKGASRPKGFALKPDRHREYHYYKLTKGGRKHRVGAHQAVALAFIGPRPSDHHQIAHSDGVRDNNHWTNLRWATVGENHRDKIEHGTHMIGETHGMARLSEDDVRVIRRRYAAGGVSQPQLAREYGVKQAHIWKIIHKQVWTHI